MPAPLWSEQRCATDLVHEVRGAMASMEAASLTNDGRSIERLNTYEQATNQTTVCAYACASMCVRRLRLLHPTPRGRSDTTRDNTCNRNKNQSAGAGTILILRCKECCACPCADVFAEGVSESHAKNATTRATPIDPVSAGNNYRARGLTRAAALSLPTTRLMMYLSLQSKHPLLHSTHLLFHSKPRGPFQRAHTHTHKQTNKIHGVVIREETSPPTRTARWRQQTKQSRGLV
jgi:hypothetical protein